MLGPVVGASTSVQFDVIPTNPPYFPAEPLDPRSGVERRSRLTATSRHCSSRRVPAGAGRLDLSSDIVGVRYGPAGPLIERAGLRASAVQKRSILIESFLIYELRPK